MAELIGSGERRIADRQVQLVSQIVVARLPSRVALHDILRARRVGLRDRVRVRNRHGSTVRAGSRFVLPKGAARQIASGCGRAEASSGVDRRGGRSASGPRRATENPGRAGRAPPALPPPPPPPHPHHHNPHHPTLRPPSPLSFFLSLSFLFFFFFFFFFFSPSRAG